jgi:excisionase family DNA binding protein
MTHPLFHTRLLDAAARWAAEHPERRPVRGRRRGRRKPTVTSSAVPPPSATAIAAGVEQLASVLTVDEVADLLRVNRKTAYAAIKAGEIPGVRHVGNAIRVHRDTVLSWLSQGQVRVPRPRRKK